MGTIMPTPAKRQTSRPALEQACRYAGVPITARDNLQGFAGYTDSGRAVVYTLHPRTVTDPVACALGHEIMHIALGDYHK